MLYNLCCRKFHGRADTARTLRDISVQPWLPRSPAAPRRSTMPRWRVRVLLAPRSQHKGWRANYSCMPLLHFSCTCNKSCPYATEKASWEVTSLKCKQFMSNHSWLIEIIIDMKNQSGFYCCITLEKNKVGSMFVTYRMIFVHQTHIW